MKRSFGIAVITLFSFIIIGTTYFLSCLDQKDFNLLPNLKKDETYIILIDAYPITKEMANIAGLKGEYGHVELIRNNRVFGSRPPTCTEFDIDRLIKLYKGSLYEIRRIDLAGDFKLAIQYYKENIEGEPYDLYNRNCTSLINSMYLASSGQGIELAPLNVKKLYYSDARVRVYMENNKLPIPTNPVWFPDQFTEFGEFVGQGRF